MTTANSQLMWLFCHFVILLFCVITINYLLNLVSNFKMNSYFSVKSANDDLVQKAQIQDKIYNLQNKLQSFAREIPWWVCHQQILFIYKKIIFLIFHSEYQQRLPYELLSSLANCLLDETINQIMIQLKEIQSITEKSLFEDRMRKIGKFRGEIN